MFFYTGNRGAKALCFRGGRSKRKRAKLAPLGKRHPNLCDEFQLHAESEQRALLGVFTKSLSVELEKRLEKLLIEAKPSSGVIGFVHGSSEMVSFEHKGMKKHVEQCLKSVNKDLLGPNGEKLTIRLTDDKEPDPKAPELDIQVGTKDLRANSRQYPEEIRFSTVAHELMHLLGLVDEYHEEHIGYAVDKATGVYRWVSEKAEKFAYDCRAIGKKHLLMNSESEAFIQVFGTRQPNKVVECECEIERCKTMLRTNRLVLPKDQSCPTGSNDMGRKPQPDDADKYKKDGIFRINENKFHIIQGSEAKPNTSLLMPAHFQAIINPGCRQNFSYYQCAINSYSTSKENNGYGCLLEPRPKACIDGDSTHWEAHKKREDK